VRRRPAAASFASTDGATLAHRSNHLIAHAMADFLQMLDRYSVDDITKALDHLRTSGDYNRIVNRAQQQ
jgi:hypothetical protein